MKTEPPVNHQETDVVKAPGDIGNPFARKKHFDVKELDSAESIPLSCAWCIKIAKVEKTVPSARTAYRVL